MDGDPTKHGTRAPQSNGYRRLFDSSAAILSRDINDFTVRLSSKQDKISAVLVAVKPGNTGKAS